VAADAPGPNGECRHWQRKSLRRRTLLSSVYPCLPSAWGFQPARQARQTPATVRNYKVTLWR